MNMTTFQAGGRLEEHFAGWIDPMNCQKAPIVLIGAGLSFGLVPRADEYAQEIAQRKIEIEDLMGIRSSIVPYNAKELYSWAEDCLRLLSMRGDTEESAKQRLARAMGITTDARFLAQTNIPLRGTTPRHRVLSRLAREGRVHSFWSFNWDCWLESAFEAVGMRRGEGGGSHFIAPESWKLRYHVWFKGERDPVNISTQPLFKAHGCARALHEGNDEFVISASEMDRQLSDQPPGRIDRMKGDIKGRWTVTIGWSATEGYVKQLFASMKQSDALSNHLTIIDVKVDQAGLAEVCHSYGVAPDAASIGVSGGNAPGTTDDLFLWIQTRRGFAALTAACTQHSELVVDLKSECSLIPGFDDRALRNYWCVNFMDCWLPIWLRICFMVRAQKHAPASSGSDEILPVEQRDAHIPWISLSIERADLQAAARVLCRISSSLPGKSWDFETFPGGFWSRSEQRLVLPVPVWAETDEISTVSLRSLLESKHWRDKGRIKNLTVLFLDGPSRPRLSSSELMVRKERWREALAASFSHRYLAQQGNIDSIELDQLPSLLEMRVHS